MMMFDRYREVYYRIAGLETSYLDKNNQPKNPFHKPYSVIILNKNFVKIGEKLLEPINNYSVKDWFVSSRGLCILAGNLNSSELDEDYMTFNVLEIKETEK